MRKNNIYTSIIWAVFGMFVAIQAYRLKIGTMHNPGSGFFLFGAGLMVSLASMALLLQALLVRSEEEKKVWQGIRWTQGIKVMSSLFIYVLVFRWLGFLLSTFFLLLFLFRMLEPQRWRVVILMTVLTVTLCYVLFGVFLELRFPGGLLGRMIDLLN